MKEFIIVEDAHIKVRDLEGIPYVFTVFSGLKLIGEDDSNLDNYPVYIYGEDPEDWEARVEPAKSMVNDPDFPDISREESLSNKVNRLIQELKDVADKL